MRDRTEGQIEEIKRSIVNNTGFHWNKLIVKRQKKVDLSLVQPPFFFGNRQKK